MENFKLNFILASASPRRKELIGYLGIPFQIKTMNIPEESQEKDPVKFSLEIAKQKGQAVLVDIMKSRVDQPCFIVSADTIVCLDKKIYGKPKDRNEARNYLKALSSKTHSVFTSVSAHLIMDEKIMTLSFTEESRVSFNKIDSNLMENYLATGDSLDKAGAYGIQGPSLTFISKVEGDYANVVGFPLSRFIVETQVFFQPFLRDGDVWQNLF